MIVPMKKVSLIIFRDKTADALKKLRKLGLLHIEISDGSGERLGELREKLSVLESALYGMGKAKKSEMKQATPAEAFAIAGKVAALAEEKRTLQAELLFLQAELERMQVWGELDPKSVESLAGQGISLAFYEAPRSEYELLGDAVKVLRLGAGKESVRFMTVLSGAEDEEKALAPLESYRLALPQSSPAQMREKMEALAGCIRECDEKTASYAVYTASIKNAIKQCEKDIEFEVYATGMASECLAADGRDIVVSHFTGYIEADKLDCLKQAAKENAWGLLADDPDEEDSVPTKLKNNRFVSLIYPLTDFLNIVPGYFEYDISSWFLLFILIFFGIIFGDGGYGLLICLIAGIPIVKSMTSKKPVPPAFVLVALFGLSTIIWGTLTCTWFGLPIEKIPGWLKALSIPVISNVYADKLWALPWTAEGVGLTTAQNLQIFCFSLALIQLTIAHVKAAVRSAGKKSLQILGDIGSILQLFGICYLVLSFVVNAEVFSLGLVLGGIPVGTVSIVLIAVGFVLSFVFANYEGSIVKSILVSLTNIISVLLGVVNVFSDIVSYIRLWAVGLAGAAISTTVNELAGPMLGNFAFLVFAIVLLVFGHGLNIILNVLSVVVHGIRLNTLEFSSHLNMSWSGHKFKPFEE